MSVSGGERLGSNGYAVASNLDPTLLPVSTLRPLGREARKHPPAQVRKLAESLDRFGFVLPILADRENRVVVGWGLVLAARKLGIPDVPVVTVADLEETDLRLLRLALIAEIEAVRKRMDWKFPWVSSYHSDFNYDLDVSFTLDQVGRPSDLQFRAGPEWAAGVEDHPAKAYSSRTTTETSTSPMPALGAAAKSSSPINPRRDAERTPGGRPLPKPCRLGAASQQVRQGRLSRGERPLSLFELCLRRSRARRAVCARNAAADLILIE